MITIIRGREGDCFTLWVKGHAGYAKDGGPDIVCAAASALACAALGYMTALEESGVLEGVEYRQRPGDVWLMAREGEKSSTALEVVMTGYEMLAAQYPKHVRIKGLKG